MRLDRLITILLVQPLRHAWSSVRGHVVRGPVVPILMYHSISDDSETGVAPYYRTCTSPARFREHMEFLHGNAYRTVTVSEAVQILQSPDSPFLAPNVVCLTFDDGFRDFYTEAFPVLKRFGFTATIFLPTGLIAGSSSSSSSSTTRVPKPFLGKQFLTWDHVRELHQSGIEFGSHTVSHPKLVDLDWPAIEFELRASKSEIENLLETSARTFCYPFGFPQAHREFTQRFGGMLRAAGYSCNATTETGRARFGCDVFRLRRLPVNSCDDIPLLRAKLDGAYDWLAWPQRGIKSLRRSTTRLHGIWRILPRRKIPSLAFQPPPGPCQKVNSRFPGLMD